MLKCKFINGSVTETPVSLPVLEQALAFVPRVGGEPGSRGLMPGTGGPWTSAASVLRGTLGVRFLTPAV